MILLAEHDEPSLAAKKKQQHVASETATSTPKNRVWNFFGSPLGQIRSESDLSAETATGSVQFSYENASGQGYYYTLDHLGSVREMCDSSGAIVARYSFDPYGRTTLVSGSNLATKQYAGYYAHQTSGLYLTKYRAFDPNTGRWLNRDPIGERGGVNLYDYVGNDPEDYTDPSGLVPPGTRPIVLSQDGTASNAQMQAVEAALKRVLNTPAGKRAIERLMVPDRVQLRIVVSCCFPSSSYYPPSGDGLSLDPPVVFINPCAVHRALTTAGIEAAPLEAVIAHELAHAVFGTKGYNGDPPDPVEEQLAVDYENEVRRALGLPQRIR